MVQTYHTYKPFNREIGQIDPDDYELLDFKGPVELWRSPKKYIVYVYLDIEYSKFQNAWLAGKRDELNDAKELFESACRLTEHLPFLHPLTYCRKPYSPNFSCKYC